MKVNNVCLDCGKIFQSNYAEAYCSECKQKRKTRGKNEPKYSIKQVVKMAQENNVSYGMQVAQLEGRI